MADGFSIESAQATSELVGDGEVQDVIQVWVRSKPNEVVYPMRVPDGAFTPTTVGGMATRSAQVVETIRTLPNVGDMAHVQDVSEAGILLDRMTVYVVSSNGLLSRPVAFPLSNFVPPAPVVAAGGGATGYGGGDVGIYGATGADAGATGSTATGTGEVQPADSGPALQGVPVTTTAVEPTAGPTAEAPAPEFITPGDGGGGIIGGGAGGGIIGGGGVVGWLPPIAAMTNAIGRVAAQLDAIAGL